MEQQLPARLRKGQIAEFVDLNASTLRTVVMPARNRETRPYTAPQARTVGLRFPNWTRFSSAVGRIITLHAKRNIFRAPPRELPSGYSWKPPCTYHENTMPR